MRTLPVGERALLVELDADGEVGAFHAELLLRRAAGTLPKVREIVPAARTVLLDGLDDPRALAVELARWTVPPLTAEAGRRRRSGCGTTGPIWRRSPGCGGCGPRRSRRSSAASSSGWRSAASLPVSGT
ncbi:hypothetical protein [Streptomyces sp. RKAG337]|uniref:hypothetical protein n=1 Tax=Streptomyces sp. RKAG337 TaxID=2893404 RepID=UPI0035A8C137